MYVQDKRGRHAGLDHSTHGKKTYMGNLIEVFKTTRGTMFTFNKLCQLQDPWPPYDTTRWPWRAPNFHMAGELSVRTSGASAC